jgi:flagellum-specific peptidoglycan hydrolase FlgJ
MNSGSGSFGTEPFNFTITDPQAAETVKKYMHEQTEVIVAYRIPRTYFSCHSDSQGYFMTSIKPAATNKSENKSEAPDALIEHSANI